MKYVILALALFGNVAQAAEHCGEEGVSLEVLGASAYVVWVDKVSLFLIDLGPGAIQRFDEAGGAIDTLEAAFVSERSDARAADVPALLTSAGASVRQDDLPVYGPVGTAARVATFFNAKKFDHLNSATPFQLVAHDVKDTKGAIRTIFTSKRGEVDALSVANSKERALAYRVRAQGKSLVIVGDGGAGDALIEFARGADVLVVGQMPGGRAGEIAAAAKVNRLVIPFRADAARAAPPYKGPVSFAADRECFR